ncbi:MAG: caspase family protein [Bacteroidia bacterium]|nr:caspase family protein [Bacteroidia bacterium]
MPDPASKDLLPDDRPAPPNIPRRCHFLGIGIDRYADAGITDLRNAVKDVRDLAQILQDCYQFQPAHIRLLSDADASRRGIIRAIDQLIRDVQPGDNAVLLFSGHGWLDSARSQGFWIPADAELGDKATYIRNQEVFDELKDIQAHHLLLIVDSCFSGAMFKDLSSPYTAADELDKRPSRRVLTSGLDTRVSDGQAGDGNSPFAAALLHTLREGAPGGLTLTQLLPELRRRTGPGQTPQFRPLDLPGDGLGEFVFHKTDSEAADYQAAAQLDTLPGWRDFLTRYPRSPQAEQVQARIRALEDEAVWQAARQAGTEAAYDRYLTQQPAGRYRAEAEQQLRRLAEEKAWARASASDTIYEYRRFLNLYPASAHAPKAEAALERIRREDEIREAEEARRAEEVAARKRQAEEEALRKAAEAERGRLRKEEEARAAEETRRHAAGSKADEAGQRRIEVLARLKKYSPYAAGGLILLIGIAWGVSRWSGSDQKQVPPEPVPPKTVAELACDSLSESAALSSLPARYRHLLKTYPDAPCRTEAAERLRETDSIVSELLAGARAFIKIKQYQQAAELLDTALLKWDADHEEARRLRSQIP